MMKIRKFYEQVNSVEDQKQEILEIFIDKIDDEIIYHNSDFDSEQYMNFSMDFDEESKMSSLEDVSKFIDLYSKRIEILNDLKMQLNRLNNLGYEWEIEVEDPEIFINVWYKNIEETIENAFGSKDRLYINEPIMKKVL